MHSEIITHRNPRLGNTIIGDTAHELVKHADWSTIEKDTRKIGGFFVYELENGKAILRARQSTIRGAFSYLTDERVLVYCHDQTAV